MLINRKTSRNNERKQCRQCKEKTVTATNDSKLKLESDFF